MFEDELKGIINGIMNGEIEYKDDNGLTDEMKIIHDKIKKMDGKEQRKKCLDLIVNECQRQLTMNTDLMLYSVGVGQSKIKNNVMMYDVILSPYINRLRRCFKLNNSNTNYYYIELGFRNKYNNKNMNSTCKPSLSTLIYSSKNAINVYSLLTFITKGYDKIHDYKMLLEILDYILDVTWSDNNKLGYIKVSFYRALLHGMNQRYNSCLIECNNILKFDAFFVPAWITKGLSLLNMNRPHESIQVLIHAKQVFNMYLNHISETKERFREFFDGEYLIKKDHNTEFNSNMNKLIQQQTHMYLNKLYKHFEQCKQQLIKTPLKNPVNKTIKYCNSYSNIPDNTQWLTCQLPRNFSWIVYPYLCGVSIPRTKEQINAFKSMNIGLIVSVLEYKLSRDIVGQNSSNFKYLQIKTFDYKAPKLYDIQMYIKEAEHWIFERKKAVLVHCFAGKGRTGTALACFLIKWGLHFDRLMNPKNSNIPICKRPAMTAHEAIKHMRFIRPGSVASIQQQTKIETYQKSLLSQLKNK